MVIVEDNFASVYEGFGDERGAHVEQIAVADEERAAFAYGDTAVFFVYAQHLCRRKREALNSRFVG